MQDFSQFQLSPSTLTAIAAKGYQTPSPIQILAIPPLVAGRDLIAQAQTGTGKTAAFGIPMVEYHREDDIDSVVALTLVPTRELAIQVAEELAELAKGTRLQVVTVYGGVGFGKQLNELGRRGAKLVVATPGRLLDHLGRGTIVLDDVATLVLDEADRMLDMGFVRDVEKILREMPTQRQTSLFSATVPDEIRRLSKKYLYQPESVKVESETPTADKVEQFHLIVDRPEKHALLVDILHAEVPERAVVFTRTKHLARRLADRLQKGGWSSVALQGNMTQGQRERALGAFRDGKARILVATDVAARGLDVPDISHVVNYDLPDGADSYVHRIGRTARMGRAGRAITFIQPDQKRDLRDLERSTGGKLEMFYEPPAVEGKGPDKPVMLVAPQAPRRSSGAGRGGPRRYGNGGGGRRHGGGPRRGGPKQAGGSGGGGAQRQGGGTGGSRAGPRRAGGGGPKRGGPRRSR